MTNLYDALELCLRDLENGADLETVLFRYPDLADELRPILEASVAAKSIAAPIPSAQVVQRNRVRVLQHASQLRQAKNAPSYRSWTVPLRRLFVALAVVAALFITSTNLVRAASGTLPGDNLYPVKRTWEDVLVLFTFDAQARAALEVEHETRRLAELQELFAQGRSVEVDFSGTVTSQNAGLWRVAGIRVVIAPQTDVREAATVGDAVRVRGVTQVDGSILAERVDLLAEGAPLPHVDDDNSGPGSGNESPENEESNIGDDSDRDEITIEGTVDAINGTMIVLDGLAMNISGAEIKGAPVIGAEAKAKGYYDENGMFIVIEIEFRIDRSDSGGRSGTNSNNNNDNDNEGDDDRGSSGSNGNDSNDNDHDNDNDNDNHNDNDNDNDSSGGGGDDD